MASESSKSDPTKSKRLRSWVAVCIGVLVGILCEAGGYWLLRGEQQQYGVVVFVLVPFIAGFLIAVFTPDGTRAFACAVGTIFLTLSLLIFTGLEGYICCFMALPLLLAGVILGAIAGYLIKKKVFKGRADSNRFKALILVFAAMLLVGARNLEQPAIAIPRSETFEQSVEVPVPPEKAWDLIKAMKALGGPKPFLLRIGLPVPESCELDTEAVGGTRVCHFNSGIIAQEVTASRKPEYIGLRITRSTLPGRHWLKFVDADYQFIPKGAGTVVVRRTTISSKLYPRWYWRPFEAWGVQSEHRYVLADLKRRAASDATAVTK